MSGLFWSKLKKNLTNGWISSCWTSLEITSANSFTSFLNLALFENWKKLRRQLKITLEYYFVTDECSLIKSVREQQLNSALRPFSRSFGFKVGYFAINQCDVARVRTSTSPAHLSPVRPPPPLLLGRGVHALHKKAWTSLEPLWKLSSYKLTLDKARSFIKLEVLVHIIEKPQLSYDQLWTGLE